MGVSPNSHPIGSVSEFAVPMDNWENALGLRFVGKGSAWRNTANTGAIQGQFDLIKGIKNATDMSNGG